MLNDLRLVRLQTISLLNVPARLIEAASPKLYPSHRVLIGPGKGLLLKRSPLKLERLLQSTTVLSPEIGQSIQSNREGRVPRQ